MIRILPSLWFTDQAEEAATYYVSLFPDSRIDRITDSPAATPSGPPGSVKIVDFTLAGHPFTAMSAGPLDPFNHAVSFTVECTIQPEIDRLWDAFLEGGGTPEQCGWLRDRFGVCWQIVPKALGTMIADPDRTRAARAMEAMLKMVKLDLGALEKAYRGG